jgi:hypothetical protein
MSKFMKFLSIGVFVVVLGGVLTFAFPSQAVFAQAGNPPQTADVKAPALEKAFAREQTWLQKQADHLTKADGLANKVAARIAALKQKGIDTSSLEAALAAFQGQVAKAKLQHDAAALILGTHAGFDANSKVTDRDAARNTVKAAGEDLRSAHKILADARKDLVKALRDFRSDHKPTKTSTSAKP